MCASRYRKRNYPAATHDKKYTHEDGLRADRFKMAAAVNFRSDAFDLGVDPVKKYKESNKFDKFDKFVSPVSQLKKL